MNPIQSFDPMAVPSGMITTNGINKGEQILLFNSSLVCLQLEFPDKTKDILPPSWVRDWIKSGPMGTIKYSTLFTLGLTGQPISSLYGTLYEPGEHVASVNQSLQYVYAVGNTVNTNVAGGSLINLNNPPSGSPIIEVANTTSAGDVFFLDNQGNVIIGNATNTGTFKTYGQTILANSTQFNSGTSQESHISDVNGADIVLMSPVNNQIGRFSNAGNITAGTGSGQFIGGSALLSGLRLTAICAVGQIAIGTTQGTYNHNLGMVPDIVILQVNGTTSTAGSIKVDYSSFTSTTFKATASVAVSAYGLVVKL